ncbi:MAG: hypothetical protein J0L73_02275 [Verrucomicrobia bacterium]|nr:hypothetical protein [Verrucomicrobiota bacterium]
MTLHAVLLTVGDVVCVLAVLNFLFWAPLEKSWRDCCMRAAVPVAIWSALRLATIIVFREPFEEPMIGFILAPPMAIGYATLVRAIVQGVRWAWRNLARRGEVKEAPSREPHG